LNGLSLVWIRLCLAKSDRRPNACFVLASLSRIERPFGSLPKYKEKGAFLADCSCGPDRSVQECPFDYGRIELCVSNAKTERQEH
jgi:hypothetical protein